MNPELKSLIDDTLGGYCFRSLDENQRRMFEIVMERAYVIGQRFELQTERDRLNRPMTDAVTRMAQLGECGNVVDVKG